MSPLNMLGSIDPESTTTIGDSLLKKSWITFQITKAEETTTKKLII